MPPLPQVYQAYDGNVSRLVDICRESIVFERVADLTSALEMIMDDPCTAVERVKNSYDPGYDCERRFGFRNVVVNFRCGCLDVTCADHWDNSLCWKHACNILEECLRLTFGVTPAGISDSSRWSSVSRRMSARCSCFSSLLQMLSEEHRRDTLATCR